MIRLDPSDIVAAREGDRAALAAIVRAAERPVFNLALRMLANRADAEDATQEILIRIVTNLGNLREPDAAGGWAMQIACRHLLGMRRKGRVEAMRLSFEGFAADLDRGRAPLDQAGLTPAEEKIAIQQVKIGCTLAMLTCLSRSLRMAYILGDVMELSDREAASVLDITPETYRQRLSRARKAVVGFVSATCGIARADNPCRCASRVVPALAQGRIAPDSGDTPDAPDPAALSATIARLEQGRATVALMRSNPNFTTDVGQAVLALL
ncbi:RNA polymerase sigma factor [Actibacterium ureilyticum]|uniref:RNA polymerase sigma factor n=1 Tax=Actibacterium ureilyticum TaxID=1590614 RepID=UPI000BAAC93F|nr:sigma-70 family RNA polymerase sigma factor [Actibacterium ureilyticum]